MKKIVLLFLVLFAASVQAIAIILPTVYIATLSLAAFVAQLVVGIVAWFAVQMFARKELAGKKFSPWLALFFETIGKLAVAFIAVFAALWLVNPIEIVGISLAAALSALASFFLLFLSGFRRFFLASDAQKRELFRSAAVFSLWVFAISGLALFLSMEIKEVVLPDQPVLSDQPGLPSRSDQDSAQQSASKPSGAGAPAMPSSDETTNESKSQQYQKTSNVYIFFPISSKKCIIEGPNTKAVLETHFNCFVAEKGSLVPTRIYCPIKWESEKVPTSVSGSCSLENAIVPQLVPA